MFLKYFPFLFFISYTLSGELQIENKCADSGGILHSFSITECEKAPCTFKRNKSYTITAVFQPSQDSKAERVLCGTKYFGNQVTIHEVNACCGLVDGECPIVGGMNYTYQHTFTIPNFVPVGQYYVNCEMVDDAKVKQACGGMDTRVGY